MKFNNRGFFIASLSVLLLFSCSKLDTTDLGSELIPAVDNIHTFETILDVVTDNYLFDDSTRMSSQDYALGIIENDAEFGRTEAAIYFTAEPVSFGTYPFLKKDSVYIDSVVLSLGYAGIYGDSNSIQQVEVREIEPDIIFRKDTSYKISTPLFPVIPDVLGSKLVNFNQLNDSIRYANFGDTISTRNELRIHLDTSFGRRFVSFDTAREFKNDSIFKSVFKGFEVKVNEAMSPVKNALAYFDLNDADHTKLTFYCRVMRNGKLDTINPVFVYSNDPHANLINRTPANAYLSYLNNGHDDNDDKLYLQSTPGSYGLIKIPGLDTLNNRVVHQAQLIIEKLPSAQEEIFRAPDILFLDAVSTTGDSIFSIKKDFIPVQSFPGYDISLFGGQLKDDQYTFNLTRYIQGVVTNKDPNYDLRVYSPFLQFLYYIQPDGQVGFRLPLNFGTPVAGPRVIVGGGSHPDKRMRLRIIYSKI